VAWRSKLHSDGERIIPRALEGPTPDAHLPGLAANREIIGVGQLGERFVESQEVGDIATDFALALIL
jgi:hypothetical protein